MHLIIAIMLVLNINWTMGSWFSSQKWEQLKEKKGKQNILKEYNHR